MAGSGIERVIDHSTLPASQGIPGNVLLLPCRLLLLLHLPYQADDESASHTSRTLPAWSAFSCYGSSSSYRRTGGQLLPALPVPCRGIPSRPCEVRRYLRLLDTLDLRMPDQRRPWLRHRSIPAQTQVPQLVPIVLRRLQLVLPL